MKKLNKALLGSVAAVMALALCVVLAACGGSSTSSASSSSSASGTTGTTDAATGYTLIESGKLTVGSDLDYKPMEYLDEQGNATGFAYDMMSEICSRIGLELNYLSPQNFDTLITQVAGGTNMDVAVSSITINDEREELVDFSTPYYDSNQAVVVKADATYTSIDELNGKTVSAQQGTTGEEWIKENLKDSEYVPYTTISDALAALKSGKVEAVIYDLPVASSHVKEDSASYKLLDSVATGEQYGIAINKNNTALKEAIDKALADMEADGTMDELQSKWF